MKLCKWLVGMLVVAAVCLCARADDAAKPEAPAGKKVDISKLFADEVVAKGEGLEIKRSQLDETISNLNASLAATGQSLPPTSRPELESRILDQMILTRLILNHGTPDEKKKAVEQAAEFIKKFKDSMVTEEAFLHRVQAVGMTPELFKTRAEEEALKQLVVDRELGSKIIISDDAAKKFYDDNPAKFEVAESVTVMHLLLLTVDPTNSQEISDERKKEKRAQIDKLLARARGGEDFAKLVREYSEDPGAKAATLEYPIIRGQTDPRFIDLENAAFALEPKQISDVVVTSVGYYIIKALEKTPARKRAYSEVSERLKDLLRSEEIKKQLQDYYEKLKKEAGVKILLTNNSN